MHDFYIAWIRLGVNDTACGTAIGNILRSVCLWASTLVTKFVPPFFRNKCILIVKIRMVYHMLETVSDFAQFSEWQDSQKNEE